ncbi:hypothetical protein B046DRAFT_01220 [Streptomyces sp. LamerLS-316]|nr:hypothetical protein B046DRAFT_01220 [Streptomyces sp. LamerLS-316]
MVGRRVLPGGADDRLPAEAGFRVAHFRPVFGGNRSRRTKHPAGNPVGRAHFSSLKQARPFLFA